MDGARGGVVFVLYNNNIVISKWDVKLLRAFAYKFILKTVIVAEEFLLQLLRTTPPRVGGKEFLLRLLRTTPPRVGGKCSSKVQLIKTSVTGMGKFDATNMF